MLANRNLQLPEDFLFAVTYTLGVEGVFSNHPKDSGGATLYGIASNKHPEHYAYIMSARSDDERRARAKEVYYLEFWVPNKCNHIESKYIAAEVFDSAVNVGRYWAGRCAQLAANMMGRSLNPPIILRVDGDIGPVTYSALNRLSQKYELQTLLAMNLFQGMRYEQLYNRDPDRYADFIRGWMRRLTVPKELL